MSVPKSPKFTINQWLSRHDVAVALVAEDILTDEQIAEQIGKTKRQLEKWKLDDRFRAEVAAHRERIREAVLTSSIADQVRRVQALDERWLKMRQVIAERAADPTLAEKPGGTTGLIVRQLKGLGKGDDFQIVEVFEVDVGLLKELRAHEEQAAREVGQWMDKPATVIDARSQTLVLGGHLSDEERAAIIARALGGPPAEPEPEP